jgi:hypothetical protein
LSAVAFERYLKSGSGRAFAKKHFLLVDADAQPDPQFQSRRVAMGSHFAILRFTFETALRKVLPGHGRNAAMGAFFWSSRQWTGSC